MSANKQIALVPDYYKRFVCVGAACEDTCCGNWQIRIDKATYTKCRRLSSQSELKPLIDQCIKRNRSNTDEENYGKIILSGDAKCPLLSEEGWCRLQLLHGMEYLGNVCATYPRQTIYLDGRMEKALTPACPAAARLILLNPEIMTFEEIEEPINTRNLVINNINTQGKSDRKKGGRVFWPLRIFTIEILQNRDYTLSERLIIMGMFFQKVQGIIEKDEQGEVENLIKVFTRWLKQGELKDELAAVPVSLAIQMRVLRELVEERFHVLKNNNSHLAFFEQWKEGVGYTEEAQYTEEMQIEEFTQRYKDAHDKYYLPFMAKHEYILENYLVNYVFLRHMPLGKYSTIFDEYLMLALHYAMIKMHLIGIAAYHRGLTIDLVVSFIQSFARNIEHDGIYLKWLSEMLRSNNYVSLAHVAIMLKN